MELVAGDAFVCDYLYEVATLNHQYAREVRQFMNVTVNTWNSLHLFQKQDHAENKPVQLQNGNKFHLGQG